jgi:hypothetical protein
MKPNQHAVLLAVALLAGTLAPPQRVSAETFAQWALRFLGISANPIAMKGPGDDPDPGEIWIANIEQHETIKLTNDAGYRWPVFVPGDKEVVAIKGDMVVSIPTTGGRPKVHYPTNGVRKLVGFDRNNADKLLVLVETESEGLTAAELSFASGKLTPIPHDPKQDRGLMAHLRGQERVYSNTKIYPKEQSERGITGSQVAWTDVYYAKGEDGPSNISSCKPVNCNQPALSGDGRRVVFIRGEE